jgi:hypothetical protein
MIPDPARRAELEAVAVVLRDMNRDNQMLDALKAVVVAADEDTRRLAAPLINWIWIQTMHHNAIRLRRLIDTRSDTYSLVNILKSLRRTKDAHILITACSNAKDYVDNFLAHSSKSPKTTELNITKLSKNTRAIVRVFSSVYAAETGDEFWATR